jgi:hypothetical protein
VKKEIKRLFLNLEIDDNDACLKKRGFFLKERKMEKLLLALLLFTFTATVSFAQDEDIEIGTDDTEVVVDEAPTETFGDDE